MEKRLILSFNPVYQTHWIYREYFKGRWDASSTRYDSDILSILKTTYRDNTFLTEGDRWAQARFYARVWDAFFSAVCLCVGGIIAFSPLLIRLLAAESYYDA